VMVVGTDQVGTDQDAVRLSCLVICLRM